MLPSGPLERTTFAFLDLEMTGPVAGRDEICEMAVVRTRGRELAREWSSLVRVSQAHGAGSAIHGIDPGLLANAPTFSDVWAEFAACVDGAVLVAHSVAHDLRFLRKACESAGIDGERALTRPALDSLPLARRAFERRGYGLVQLSKDLGFRRQASHRALPDAWATQELFWRVIKKTGATTLQELHSGLVLGPKRRQALELELQRALADGLPRLLRYRPRRRKPLELSVVVRSLDLEAPQPSFGAYLVQGRGRRDFRVDRVLALEPSPEVVGEAHRR